MPLSKLKFPRKRPTRSVVDSFPISSSTPSRREIIPSRIANPVLSFFSEVRVPLNTALLAVQNLENEGVYDTVEKDQRDMVDGLQASLCVAVNNYRGELQLIVVELPGP